MRINDYSFKYVCVVCCLKIRFYCLTFSARLNLNSADFITPNQSSEIVILMHFGFALELLDTDLWNIDLLHTHLDLLSPDKYTDIPSQYFFCLHNIFKTSSRHVFKTSSRHVFKTSSKHVFRTSSRHLQRNNFSSSKTSSRRLERCLQDVFKTSARRLCKISSRCLCKISLRRLQDVLEDVKLLRWRRRLQDVFKTNKCLLG